MIQLLKWLRGYVRISVRGFAPERFFNLCSNKKILLWDIKMSGEQYEVSISLSGFLKLRGITRKTKTRVVILNRYGLPFLLPKVWKRKIFVFGFFLAFALWFISSVFVWKISLTGNTAVTEDVFLEFLKQNGVYVGLPKEKLDLENLEKQIRRSFPDITWCSVKVEGTVLLISVKENEVLQTQAPKEDSSSLYAEKEGRVLSIITRSGIPCVSGGDDVEEGTLLVSGQIPVYAEDGTVRKYQYTAADADILVERTTPVYLELPYTYLQKVYTGREKDVHYLKWGDRILLEWGGSCPYLYADTVVAEREYIPLKGLKLPFSIGTKTYREYQNTLSEYTLAQARSLLSEKYSKFLSGLEEKGVQIIEKNVKMDTKNNAWILTGSIHVVESIGVSVPIAENQPDLTEGIDTE